MRSTPPGVEDYNDRPARQAALIDMWDASEGVL